MRVNSLAIRWLAVLLALCLAVPQLLEARVEPTRGFDLFSAQEEVQAGQQAAGQVGRQLPVLPDSDAIARYVQRLGRPLGSDASRGKGAYSFHVVNQE